MKIRARHSERRFQRMLPYLTRIFDRLPAATTFASAEFASQPEWFAQSLRDAIRAKATFDWAAPGLNEAAFNFYWRHIQIEVLPDGSVRAGLDNSEQYIYVKPECIDAVAQLVAARAFDPQPNFVCRLEPEKLAELESKYDLCVMPGEQAGTVIIR